MLSLVQQLRQHWIDQQATLNSWIAIANPFSAEIMAQQPFDSLTIDLQHGLIDYNALQQLLPAIKHRATLVRIPWLHADTIMKVLDAGVGGIICPMINTLEDAQQLVQFSNYPPLGERSFGPIRAAIIQEQYFQHANAQLLIFAMIETKQAVENAEAIMSASGLDGIYIGPSDLAISYGYQPGFDRHEQELINIIKRMQQLAQKHKKFIGIHNGSLEYAMNMVKLGFNFVTVGSDVRFMSHGAKELCQKFQQFRIKSER